MEKIFEQILWNSRLVVLAAVIASMAAAIAMFYMASVDAVYMISHLGDYASPSLSASERVDLRSSTVTHVVEIVDGYLLATVLLIFSLGLYELFVSKIDHAEGSENASNVLMITSLDDLKSRLAKVVMMILVVRYFEFALGMDFVTPMDLLQFAAGIALLGIALYFSHMADKGSDSDH
ncbi:MAG: YqhA family protein [Candidatus Thiodiazotropha sp. (ex Codakia rugifera)]|nr:YqhA family protein [Candidatus Thiodiazotropha sp. (ex Codakia rugifera)]